MSALQCHWLSFVILGLLVTNSLCWSRFERFGLNEYKASAICWMFKKAKIAWDFLLHASVLKIIESYSIHHGVLVIDDTDAERSKYTKQIAKVHTIRDKKSAGYFRGQNIIFLVLVTDKVTIPVGFEFYQPDPEMSAWVKEDKRLRGKKVPKKFCPEKPEPFLFVPTLFRHQLPSVRSLTRLTLPRLIDRFNSAYRGLTPPTPTPCSASQ